MYKGKHREGRDKADPTMWKTRLRCALNKSTDFQEVPERNQLDITEPYKVYLILNNNAPLRTAGTVVGNHLFLTERCSCRYPNTNVQVGQKHIKQGMNRIL